MNKKYHIHCVGIANFFYTLIGINELIWPEAFHVTKNNCDILINKGPQTKRNSSVTIICESLIDIQKQKMKKLRLVTLAAIRPAINENS